MINIKINFIIKENESLDFVYEIINEFIKNIKQNEPGTFEYESFQYVDNERHFFHLMSFVDEKARMNHKNTSHCKEFVSKLYPLCNGRPKAIEVKRVNKKRIQW